MQFLKKINLKYLLPLVIIFLLTNLYYYFFIHVELNGKKSRELGCWPTFGENSCRNVIYWPPEGFAIISFLIILFLIVAAKIIIKKNKDNHDSKTLTLFFIAFILIALLFYCLS